MKRSDKNFLRSLILEQVEELFAKPDAEEEVESVEEASADNQIDAFILKFERDSMSDEDEDSQSLSESLVNLSLNALLLEQGGEEEEAEVAEEVEPAGDEGGDTPPPKEPAPEDSSDSGVEPAKSLPKPPIDIEAFTKRVARLAMNYDNLLDMKTIIVNRAMNFLLENYDEARADEMKDVLDSQFDFDLDGGKEVPTAPYAVGAYAGGTGQMGGGG